MAPVELVRLVPEAEADRHNHTKPSAQECSPFPCAVASVNEPCWSREVVSSIHGLLAESQVMSKEKKPGFLRRLFGGEPAADAPSRKATEKTAEVRNRKVEAASAAAPPPAGPAAPPGVRAKPRTRKKGTPKDKPGPQSRGEGSKPGTDAQPDKAEPRQTSRIVPPPPASKK
jgi:hypothetical protein